MNNCFKDFRSLCRYNQEDFLKAFALRYNASDSEVFFFQKIMKEITYGMYYPNGMKRADIHVHTSYTDGWACPERIVDEALEKGLHTVVITDHNTVCPADRAKEYSLQRGYRNDLVLVGSEIDSRDGHILAIGIESDIKPYQPAEDTIQQIHMQNGLAIAAHPGLKHTHAITLSKLTCIMDNPDRSHFDGIEVYNANAACAQQSLAGRIVFTQDSNDKTRRYYETYKSHPHIGAAVGGSDAHLLQAVAVGATGFYGNSLMDAIRERRTYVLSADNTQISGTVMLVAQYLSSRLQWKLKHFFKA